MRSPFALLAVGCCALAGASASGALQSNPSEEPPQAYVGARLLPISGPPIENGALLVHRGKIVAVGPRAAVTLPAGAKVHDVSGKTLMPGLVDTHSHVGGGAGADSSAPLQPEVRLLDSVNPRHSGFQRVQAGGITTVNVMPGSGHLLSGQTLYLKVRDARTIDEMLIHNPDGSIAGGIKMANGTNSLRGGAFPGTRGKSAALIRTQFLKAQEYRDKVRQANGDKAKLPARDLALEALAEVLDGKRVVHFHTHRHDDIVTVLRLQNEFKFRVVLQHVSEGWKVAPEIAAAKVPASLIVLDSPGGKQEAVDVAFRTAAVLDQAGVLVGFHTDDPICDSRLLLRSAALAVRAGLPHDRALHALTLAGARMLDLQDRIGSLEPGKDADFIVLSGDPLSVYTKVLQTYVDGVRVFDREKPEDRLYAVGGYEAARDQTAHLDCFLDLAGHAHEGAR